MASFLKNDVTSLVSQVFEFFLEMLLCFVHLTDSEAGQ